MTFSLKVKNNHQDANYILEKDFNGLNDIKTIKSLVKNNFWHISAQFIPVRTNNLKNFAQDFFIPGLLQLASQIHSASFVDKLFLGFFGGVLDVGTFPFRVLTIIPRAIYNMLYPKEKDLFYQYLLSQGVSKQTLKQDSVYIELNWVENINNGPFTLRHGEEKYPVGFIALPERYSYPCKRNFYET